jgi:DNA-cytosine methyltransferase
MAAMNHTFADLLSGGGGASLGAMAAGLRPVWAVEKDHAIADSYERNIGKHDIRAKVQDVDYTKLERVWWLHASPICTNASQAKTDAKETADDLEVADACCRAIRESFPVNISLENVYPYRHFQSFKNICKTLEECGYNFKYWNLNAADYGVPQTRKRLILLASRERKVTKPTPTHIDPAKMTGQGDLFSGQRLPWIGWYEAIEDLIPTLPDSQFAEWQLKRLPEEMRCLRVDSAGFDDEQGKLPVIREADQPAATILSNYKSRKLRAFLVTDQHSHNGESVGVPNADAPTMTVDTRPSAKVKAFIVSNAKTEWGDGIPDAVSPAHCVTGETKGRAKAFIIDGKQNNSGESVTLPQGDAPIFAVVAQHGQRQAVRAFVIDGQNARDGRLTFSPEVSLCTPSRINQKLSGAKLSQGRVVAMTPQALARFQSIPDSYELPEKTSLACRIIGNAVAPLLMEKIIKECL